MVPSFKNTALIFTEISFIQYFTIFNCKQYGVITNLICIIEERQYGEVSRFLLYICIIVMLKKYCQRCKRTVSNVTYV